MASSQSKCKKKCDILFKCVNISMLVTSSAPIALSSGLIKFGFGRAAAPSQTDKSASGFPTGTLTPSRPPPALVPVWELAQRGGGEESEVKESFQFTGL